MTRRPMTRLLAGAGPFDRYRELFGVPQLPSLLLWSLAGRLHVTCTALVLTFLITGWTGSYGLAGIVVGALTVGQTVSAPWWGRAADRGDAVRLVAGTSLGYGAGLVGLAALPAVLPATGWPVAAALAGLTGLVLPPVNQILRGSCPRLAPPELRNSVYTVDATLQEVLFAAGPLLAAATVALAGPTPGTLLVAGFVLVGGIGFAVVLRRAGLDTPVPDAPAAGAVRRRSLLTDPGLAALIVAMGLLVGGLVATDLVIIAWARDRGAPFLAGVLAAVWAAGSLFGGLVAGARASSAAPRLGQWLGAVFVGMAILVPMLPPVARSTSPVLLGVVLFLGGTMIAPAMAAAYHGMALRAPEHRRAEAFGWQSTASRAGAALAAPAVGVCLDGIGPAGGAALAALALAAAAAVVTVARAAW
jgi:hypothetical protein